MVCSRCLGLYPLLFGLIAAQIALRAPMSWLGDIFVALVLPLPALVDWGRGRFNPRTGTNALRLATGLLLGAALARTLYLHMRVPFHGLAALQLGLLLVSAAGVELAVRLRPRPRVDPNAPPDVEDGGQRGSGT